MTERLSCSPIVEAARDFFINTIESGTPIYPRYPEHAKEVERLSLEIIPFYPQANIEIVQLLAWGHDIGWFDGDLEIDHAIKSSVMMIKFLRGQGYPENKIQAVAHGIRAHRCKDVQPTTIEAQILVAADSLSHMTDLLVYPLMLSQKHLGIEDILAKLERDYRDTLLFLPEDLKPKTRSYYEAWKTLLNLNSL
ncbi:MAG: HD domain-containing protein [bacterium]